MEMAFLGKKEGKTYGAIKKACEEGLTLVCNKYLKRELPSIVKAMGYELPNCLTYEQFDKGEFDTLENKGFVFDQLNEYLLNKAKQIPIEYISYEKKGKDVLREPWGIELPEQKNADVACLSDTAIILELRNDYRFSVVKDLQNGNIDVELEKPDGSRMGGRLTHGSELRGIRITKYQD